MKNLQNSPSNDNSVESLTKRELEILALIAENRSNQEIANSLYLSLSTVKWHTRRIYDKLGVNKRQKAVDRAIQLGYLKERGKTFVAYRGSAPRHNLPSLLPAFFGRDQEQEELIQLLSTYRLVTLVGTGGIGKTTLSLHLAQKLKHKYPDGVWFVELAPLSDLNLISQAVLTALGISDQPNISQADRLRDVLRKKTALILLDNCEHLLDACAELANVLLNHCPHLQILTTSREPLRVPGEALFNVPPLAFPDVSVEELIGKMQESPAVRLFLNRARLADSRFSLSSANALFILQICNQLDGLPLALELAAARVNVLSVEQIAARLKENFSLLTQGSRTVLPRHQTLQTSLEWSWDLLSEQERVLLRRLSVFAGGWTLEAAEAVCSNAGIASKDILDVLSQLVSKSLVHVQQNPEQEVRYHLLEMIRQYAQAQLAKSNETEEFRQRHLDYYLQLAQQAEPALIGPEQGAWFNRLERELDNIRAALTWAQATHVEAGIHIISAITWFCWARGNTREMEAWLAAAMRNPVILSPLVKAKALLAQGRYVRFFSRREDLLGLLEESLALYRELDVQTGIANALTLIGSVLIEQNEYDKAEPLLQESLAICRKTNDNMQMADTLCFLGHLKRRVSYQEAEMLLEESLSLYRKLGNFALIAVILTDLGELAIWQGNFKTARRLLEESVVIQERLGLSEITFSLEILGNLYYRLGDYSAARTTLEKAISSAQQTGMTNNWALHKLGFVYLRLGEFTTARQMFVDSLAWFSSSDSTSTIGVVISLEGLASLATHQEHEENAARLFGWADTMRQSIRDARPPVEQEDVDKDITIILERMDEETYTQAYAEGKKMTMEQAIALALEE